MPIPFIPVAVLVGGYLVLRSKSEGKPTKGDPQSPNATKDEVAGAVDAGAAAAAPGIYTTAAGGLVESDGNTLVPAAQKCGTDACTPSDRLEGGNTSTAPSSGTADLGPLGVSGSIQDKLEAKLEASEQTPAEVRYESDVPTIVRYGTTNGLTSRQLSKALEEEGPANGSVW